MDTAGGGGTRRFVVLNDAPVGDGAEDDLLEVDQVARGLADLIVASRATAPFTLAVDGAWGMGKSSLLHRLEATLSAEPAVSAVWFNAWTSGRASALEGLIKSVLLRFDRNVLRRALRSMSQRAHLLGVVRGAALALASFFGAGRVVDEMWQRMSLDAQARNEIKGVLRDAFGAWLAKGGEAGDRRLLVVFVDDLDRCASERIVEVCEAIKLYLDVPGIVFVLACDQSALWRAVRESAGVAEPAAAVEYLEKIVQISYRIPAPSAEQATRLVDGYLARSHTSGLFGDSLKDVIIARSGRNPRRIKRLINSFVLEYHLNRSWDEVGLENLVKVILLQHFYPGFYRLLANPRHDDLISEFLDYQRYRGAVKQGDEPDPDRWAGLFGSKGLRPPSGAESLLELEGELPAEFPALAADRDFVALLHSVDGPSRRLVEQLRRRPLATVEPPAPASRPEVSAPRPVRSRRALRVSLPPGVAPWPALRDLRVLWIDDHPGNNTELAGYLDASGVRLDVVTGRGEAVTGLARSAPDAVLSDFRRGQDDDAGLNDLAFFREGGHHDGPVLFFSGRIPELALQERIRELGADGPTNNENDVVRWLEQVATAKKRDEPGRDVQPPAF